MLGLAVAVMLAAASRPDLRVYEGACDYPNELGAPKPSEQRVACEKVVLAQGREPHDVIVQFVSSRTGKIVGFAGPIEGDDLAVRRVYPRAGASVPASGGHCRIFFQSDVMSGISCVGKLSGRTYIANFRTFVP